MAKIAVFLAEGMEEIEALTVVDICRRAQMDVQMVSVTNEKMVTSSHGVSVQADVLLSEVSFEELDMIVLPGGMPGTRNLEACQLLMEQVDAFNEKEKGVAAICAAPSILGHRGILNGRNACCYPGFEEELSGAAVSMHPVEVSGHVITSRGMGTAIEFALAIVTYAEGNDCAEKIKKAIIYQQ